MFDHLLFIGECPGDASLEEYEPLRAKVSSGKKLMQILAVSEVQYSTIRRTNLIPFPIAKRTWNYGHALWAAKTLLKSGLIRDIPNVVLLGAKVQQAFGYRNGVDSVCPQWREHPELNGRLACMPHPSGLSRYWNAPGHTEMWREFILATVIPQPYQYEQNDVTGGL